MRPPLCAVCGADGRATLTDPFRVVEFADFQPPPDGLVGGPWPGSDWFCPRHAGLAERERDLGGSLGDALDRLRRMDGAARRSAEPP